MAFPPHQAETLSRISSSSPGLPLMKPGSSGLSAAPFIASLVLSQNIPISGGSFPKFTFNAWVKPGSIAVFPAAHGSPYTSFSPLPKRRSRAVRMRFIKSVSRSPIRSKRKPSIWYSSAQYRTELNRYEAHMGRSLAMSLPQAEPLETLPSSCRR